MTQFAPQPMSSSARAEMIDLISRIQTGEGGSEEIKALERATGNPNVWIIFNELEIDGMSPDKLFDLFFATKHNTTV
jgi:hypothetical protein